MAANIKSTSAKNVSCTKKDAKKKAVQRVLNAAMEWHRQYHVMRLADYHAYCRAFNRLDLACKRLKKVSP